MNKIYLQRNDMINSYLQIAADFAQNSTCLRARCGAAIISSTGVLVSGACNSPPQGKFYNSRCTIDKATYHPKVTLKTCCIHAEQRAIMEALKLNPDALKGSTLYFTRIDKDGKLLYSGKPYCTLCSGMALEAEIAYFVLNHQDGPIAYETSYYHKLSYEYTE